MREVRLQAEIKRRQFAQRQEEKREEKIESLQRKLDRDIEIARKRKVLEDKKRTLHELRGETGGVRRGARVAARAFGVNDKKRKAAESAVRRFLS